MTVDLGWQKMNPTFKEEWVQALRSGKYLQAKEVLKGDVYKPVFDESGNEIDVERVGLGYCCLGVLCDISGHGKWIGGGAYELTFPNPLTDEYGDLLESQDSDAELEPETRDFFGLAGNVASKLMTMNDSDETSFAGIADWIEENL